MRRPVLQLNMLLSTVLLCGACQDGDRATLPGGGFSKEGLDSIQEMMETAIADGRISAGIALAPSSRSPAARPSKLS